MLVCTHLMTTFRMLVCTHLMMSKLSALHMRIKLTLFWSSVPIAVLKLHQVAGQLGLLCHLAKGLNMFYRQMVVSLVAF